MCYLCARFIPGILGDAPRTVAFWLKMPPLRTPDTIPDTGSTRTVIGWGSHYRLGHQETLNHKFTIHFDYALDRYPMLNISFGGFWYFSPGTELDNNTWHHVAVIYSGDYDSRGHPVTRLYINGKPRDLRHAAHPPIRTTKDGRVEIKTKENTPLTIGANLSSAPQKTTKPNQYFNGQIDELYIIEAAISEQTVIRLMKANQLTP